MSVKVNIVNQNFESDYVKNLLKLRGVEDVDEYLNPTAASLLDFNLLDYIKEGRKLLQFVLNKENSKILIVVDCDVDGYTSAAIIYNYIHTIEPEQHIDYILHEHKQHGLEDVIDKILDSDTFYDLVILPDSSSNDYEYHLELAKIGTDCLILDHHDLEPVEGVGHPLRASNAVIINNQISDNYPNKELTGAGVTWQFCRAHEDLGLYPDHRGLADSLIDLAALGVCGDMGSILTPENRYIMIEGFKNVTNYFFEKAIEKKAYNMNNEVTPISVAFYIVPMMNAMIRIGSMDEKERLFLGLIDGHRKVPCNKRGAKGTFEEVAIESLRECENAKSRQNKITDQMVLDLEQKIFKYNLLDNKILFVRLNDDDDYPSEVVGLAAMKIAAKYKRPTIIARLNPEGYDRGSIRNVSDCELRDLKGFLNGSGYFEWVQGHPNAAGASILDSNLRAFHTYANEQLKEVNFTETLYDANFERQTNSEDLIDMIYDLGGHTDVWGQGCKEPLIYIPNIYINSTSYSIIGANKDTLRFERNGVTYIKFHAGKLIEELGKYTEARISIVGKANLNEWMGRVTPQIQIEDYEVMDDICAF